MCNFMSNRLFQTVIHQMKDAIDKTFGVMDANNTIIACSELGRIGEQLDISVTPVAEGFTDGGYTFKPVVSSQGADYTVFVEGTDIICNKYALVIAVAFSNIKNYYDEKYDRGNFIKDIILDNILPGDIYLKARELHFNNEASRVVLLIRLLDKSDVSVYDVVQNLFPDKTKDFVINISENDIALVKEVKSDVDGKDLEKLARSISDALSSEIFTHALVGIGTPVVGVKDLARSFKEAQVALEVGKVFDTEKNVISYDNLGIGRLIYQLPTTLCELFLNEVLKKESIDVMDSETIYTIQKFFENNLNVSETSRKLFVHRNTLVYRLDKIKKLTGIDLREFDDAITFKVAMMVSKYLKSQNNEI